LAAGSFEGRPRISNTDTVGHRTLGQVEQNQVWGLVGRGYQGQARQSRKKYERKNGIHRR
jgi:hypothetical protein